MIINANHEIDRGKEDHTKYIGLLEAYAKGATTHRALPAPPRVAPAPRDETQSGNARPLRVQSQRAVYPWPSPPAPMPRPEGDDKYRELYPALASGPKSSKEMDYRRKVTDYRARNKMATSVTATGPGDGATSKAPRLLQKERPRKLLHLPRHQLLSIMRREIA